MKLFHFAFITALLTISTLTSTHATSLPNTYKAQLIRVIDADTIKLRLELYPGLFKEVNLRIAGIDAPESRRGKKSGVQISECEVTEGKAATEVARKILAKSNTLIVKNIDLSKTKYVGRITGELWFALQQGKDATLINFASYIVKQGFAVKYTGGARAPWPCM